jgi:hypothetical protein
MNPSTCAGEPRGVGLGRPSRRLDLCARDPAPGIRWRSNCPATQSYRIVHEALATALRRLGVAAVAKAAPDPDATRPPGGRAPSAGRSTAMWSTPTPVLKIAGAARETEQARLAVSGLSVAASGGRDRARLGYLWPKFHGHPGGGPGN